jgi:hypothetical protein
MSDLASRITNPNEPAKDSSKDAEEAANAQVDSAAPAIGGSALHEADGDVEVTISGGDNDAPIYSASTWEDLGLYVPWDSK